MATLSCIILSVIHDLMSALQVCVCQCVNVGKLARLLQLYVISKEVMIDYMLPTDSVKYT